MSCTGLRILTSSHARHVLSGECDKYRKGVACLQVGVRGNMAALDSERYAESAITTEEYSYRYCSRTRCDNHVVLQLYSKTDLERRWRYDESVVVVSTEDGTQKHAFCSRKCASLWLMS